MSESDLPVQIKAFCLVGDSNIRNNVNKTNCRAHPAMKSAQVLICTSLEVFVETLRQIKTVSDVCVVSCLTNFIASADGPITNRVAPC